MPLALDFFLHYAYWIIFLWVLVEQLGVPIPSVPLLLTAGTLTATHKLNLSIAVHHHFHLKVSPINHSRLRRY